jgi:hypothetical protein
VTNEYADLSARAEVLALKNCVRSYRNLLQHLFRYPYTHLIEGEVKVAVRS